MTESSKPPLGRRMKGHAPPPPQVPQPAPRHIFRNSEPEGGRSSAVDGKENILRPSVDLQLTLPWGNQMSVTEDGSKALMDLLVELCGHHHLNPALHTLELLSPEGHSLGFKPNALLGSLNVACVLIKEKASEDKVARRPAPKVPEKTVRLMVNYHVSQKAVVRVNPLAPLQALVPVICNKCEFDPAHVLLLKDGISRHELPLGKSLTELGIKELYVHDQSIVFQPKMASAPALNCSDSICSSTANLGRPQKKGLLGIFPFSGRKSQTETTAMDMDDCDDKIIQNTDTRSNGLSTVPGVYGIEPGTLGQSQSVANISRISTKTETKKRRAPAPPGAPTPSMGHTGFESNPVGLGSESQLRKRKAPAPPPTPSSLTQDSDYTSTPAAPTPESPTIEISTPAYRTKVAQSTRVSDASVVVQMVKPAPLKIAVQPPPVREASPTTSSPSPSSSTNDSLAVQDSSSELGHSLDDSDADLELSGSCCSTSSTASGSVQAQPATKSSRSTTLKSTSSPPAQKNQEETSDSSSRSETESALNLKLDEVENNRHSAIENGDRPVPPKPRRSPIREPRQLDSSPTLSVSPSPSPPIDPADSIPPQDPLEVEEAGPQSWLHSMQSSTGSGKKQETEAPEAETLSLDSSSGGSSLPDHGYAASEGMAEGEDSCMVSSPSDTLPTSPDGSLSQGGRSGEARGEKRLQPARDSSSDSDEGCATWRSKHRHSASHQAQSVKSNEDDSELTAQLHQTLADLEADLADHKDIVSEKDSRYTMSTNSNEVPVSVVDMDVPVTAIDEVLEEYEHDIIEHEGKSLTSTESAGSKGPCFNHKSCAEPQNKNNNAYTAAVSDKRSAKQYQSEQHRKSLDDKSPGDEKEVKMHKAKMKVDPRSVRETKKNVAVKSYVDMKNNGKNSEILPDPVNSNSQSFQQNKPALTPKKPASPPVTQRLGSPEKDEGMQRDYQGNSSLSTAHGKITCNVTSRLGMKTFTVVPPKPTVMHNATIQPAVAPVAGAIKIDDQGNLVKMSISRSKPRQSSESESDEASYLLGKAKAFWSSNERQENAVTERKSLFDKAMESTNDMDSAPTGGLEATLKTSHTEYQKTTRGTVSELAQTVQPKAVEEEAKKPLIVIKVANKDWADVGSKISVSKNVQQPNSKPALPPQLPQDLQKDLSFLKPPRRTSSHYVASALAKYTPKTSANPSSIPKAPDFSPSLKTQTATGLQISGWSMQETSSASSLSDDKEIVSSSIPNPPGPNRSMSYPEYVSHSQRDVGEEKLNRKRFENLAVSTKEGSNMSVTETSKNDNNQSSGSTLIKVTANNNGGHIKHIWPSSPSPTTSSAPHSFSKPPTAPKITSIAQRSGFRDVTKAATDVKPQHGVTVSHSDGTPGPAAVTVFGPVKKFKPVIQRSAEKETSLHSSLMEAIQTGGGRDGLKKISTSGPSNQKKETYVEEETERSALLAAIRAQSNSSRLRKTKSEAANELGKSTSEEERSVASSLSPPSLSSSSPVFKPPPPPPMVAPPPVLSQNKPGAVASPNTHTPMNPASPREAMLEAIRSGAAAERLKKVSVPKKTVQVNGRLGTVQAATSTLPQH